jgi:hypothetical protein
VQLDPNRNVIYAHAFGGQGVATIGGIGVDMAGNVTIAGSLPAQASIDFGSTSVAAPSGSQSTYIVQFDESGATIAARATSDPAASVSALACEPAGTCELAGSFQGDAIDFGCGQHPGYLGRPTLFTTRVDSNLTCIASETNESPHGSLSIDASAIASNGDTFAAGSYSGTVEIGQIALPPRPTGNGIFVARLAP